MKKKLQVGIQSISAKDLLRYVNAVPELKSGYKLSLLPKDNDETIRLLNATRGSTKICITLYRMDKNIFVSFDKNGRTLEYEITLETFKIESKAITKSTNHGEVKIEYERNSSKKSGFYQKKEFSEDETIEVRGKIESHTSKYNDKAIKIYESDNIKDLKGLNRLTRRIIAKFTHAKLEKLDIRMDLQSDKEGHIEVFLKMIFENNILKSYELHQGIFQKSINKYIFLESVKYEYDGKETLKIFESNSLQNNIEKPDEFYTGEKFLKIVDSNISIWQNWFESKVTKD